MSNRYVLNIQSPDVRGIVAAVTTYLAEHGCSIDEAAQHQDDLDHFFMRISFVSDAPEPFDEAALRRHLAPVTGDEALEVRLFDLSHKPRVLLMVSKFGHCLYDLLHRWRSGQLPVEIVGVASNHDDMRSFVEWNGLPYHWLPVTKDSKDRQEDAIIDLIEREAVDLVVLARYMQILSPEFCGVLSGRAINIHHSFLPSFKGAKPYFQAHARGVKLIGATAHYVTADLDEGPIIEQDVERVNHSLSAEDLTAVGRDVECVVLARAVRWHVEHRVLTNGHKTVVFQ